MNKIIKSFSGGLDTVSIDTQVADDSYTWLINARNRFGFIDPISKHVKLQNVPEGIKQELISVGSTLIVFVAGKAYYQVDGASSWIQIPGIQMSSTAYRLYTISVPYSFKNFVRKASFEGIQAPIRLTTDFNVNGTPAGIIVQDGENQPWLIQYDSVNQIFTSRVLQTYDEWDNTDGLKMEYVPVGKFMMYLNGILYIISRDLKKVYRSITGRPLDFMVNVDTDGNKLASEYQGGADSVSFALDDDEITCLQPVNFQDSFLYGTKRNVRLVVADYTETIFGEPTYRVATTIKAGIVNNRSLVEIQGDYAFIDYETVVSMNAVLQLKFNGRNSQFSLPLSKMLHNKKQRDPICFMFQNYAIFNIDTIFGNIMAVYDVLRNQYNTGEVYEKKWIAEDIQRNKWTGIDITDVTRIKQYAITELVDKSKLYVITHNNDIYQMFADEENTYTTQMKTKSFITDESRAEHKTQFFRPVFRTPDSDNGIRVIEYVDEMYSQEVTQPISSLLGGVNYPVIPPVIPSNNPKMDNPAFTINKGLRGKKISFIMQWTSKAKLIEYQFLSSEIVPESGIKQSDKVFKDTYGPTD